MRLSIREQVTKATLAALLLAAPTAAKGSPKPANAPAPPTIQEQLAQQQQRIDELERLLRQQGLLLEALRQQLAQQQAPAAPGPASASAAAPAVETSAQQPPPEQELDRLSGELDALAEHNKELGDKVNSLEKKANDSEKSLSAKLKGLGNFSFGGDLRLRFEPFRGGTGTERNRGRFRARLDVKNKFNDEWAAGLRISSGDDTDPISTNQTLTGFYERKPFNLDQAYVIYTPTWAKPLSLTGGKFAYTWKRTELTLDNDLNPEGLSPVLNFDIKSLPLLTNVKLVAFALPFFESSGGPDSYTMGGALETSWKLGSRAKFVATANYTDWFRTDTVRVALVGNLLTGSTNRNAASATAFASRFGLLDLIGQLDFDTGHKKWPLTLLFDYVTNTRACANQSVAGVACNAQDRQGYWAEISVGQTKERHDLQAGYTLIHIEREAVLGAFNFSDLRASTDVLNHRFIFNYQAYKNITLGYTLLVGRLLSNPNEPWLKRSQIDLLYKF